jgi:hypothetical protein
VKHNVHNLLVLIIALLRSPARLAVGLEAKNLRLESRYAPVPIVTERWFPRPCPVTEFGIKFERILANALG